ncbi:unnamed protein product [Leptidea sinapis]|uniref:Uncharacterized protein n=1 Tax=Leptidea sinapis TaxID=189913 RepID=A0A5E4QXQ7_9NEOP|nr:unnamed protein product [Leptidea sinapis]
MTISEQEVISQYHLHWLVWHNKHTELQTVLQDTEYTDDQLELKDPRGRTPLMLAITIGHIDCVRVLLDAGANVNCEKDGWTAVQEATARGDAALLALVLGRRDWQRNVRHAAGVPELLDKLSLAPDFYVEMKWEFSSWVPLVARLCPSDTYRVFKRGANVRLDTTLLGFSGSNWERGDRSYDKTESVSGYECKVFTANDVQVVSRARWEHVPRQARAPRRPLASPLAPLLAAAPAPDPAPPGRGAVAGLLLRGCGRAGSGASPGSHHEGAKIPGHALALRRLSLTVCMRGFLLDL